MSMNRGGLFWGKLTYQNLERMREWSDVVLNDSQVNGPENVVETPIEEFRNEWRRDDRRPCPRLWLSINALNVFVNATGKPSVYWPMQGRLHAVAEECNGWMKETVAYSRLTVEEVAPWGRVRFLDLSNRTLGIALAYEMAAAAQYADGIFLDEAHSTITDIRGRHPGVTITDEAWCKGLRFILRQYATLMGGRPKPVITNGTFGREHSALVSGRFWQATRAADLEANVADSEGAAFTMLHSCGDMATPAQLGGACMKIEALGGEACYSWTPTNGPFVYDWIPPAVDQISLPMVGDEAK